MASTKVKTLAQTVRELRAAGRKRAMVGAYQVYIKPGYALFEPKDNEEEN
jgi:hypothetical protein